MKRLFPAGISLIFVLIAFTDAPQAHANEMVVEVIRVYFHKAEDLLEKVKRSASRQGRVTVHVPSNSIIVRDYSDHVDAIKRLIKRLDVRPRQIRITAGFTGREVLEKGGIKIRWFFSDAKWSMGALPPELASGYGLEAAPMSAMRRLDVVNRQLLLLKNGARGSVAVSDLLAEPGYFIEYGTRHGYIYPGARFNRIGASFDIVASIIENGAIEIKLLPRLSRLDGGSDIRLPDARTLAIIENGDTVVIGGRENHPQSFGSRFLTSGTHRGDPKEQIMILSASME